MPVSHEPNRTLESVKPILEQEAQPAHVEQAPKPVEAAPRQLMWLQKHKSQHQLKHRLPIYPRWKQMAVEMRFSLNMKTLLAGRLKLSMFSPILKLGLEAETERKELERYWIEKRDET